MAATEQAGVELIWRRASKGRPRGRFLALRVRPAGVTPAGWHQRPAGAAAVLAAGRVAGRQARADQVWLSNLPDDTPLVELVRLARLRWRVEMVFPQLTKGWVRAVG